MRQISLLILTALLSIQMAVAAPINKTMSNAEKAITTELKKIDPDISIETINPSPIEAIYEVTLKNGRVLHISATGKYLISGDMLEIRDEGLVNLSEETRNKVNVERLKSMRVEDMIVFSPEDKAKAIVYAFTDVDCGYCRKLHQEVAEMNKLGIELRYMAFPRGDNRSPAYSKMVDAWCSADRKQAMTDLKTGKTITSTADDKKKASCKAIIESQHQLGGKMGVTGTPAMVLENGQMIPGYRPAKELAKMLGLTETPAK